MMNVRRNAEPRVNMDITMGLLLSNCTPMPEIGIRSSIDPAELRKMPT